MAKRTSTWNYLAYGLSIRSSIPLSEFVPGGTGEAEVVVSFGEDSGWVSPLRDTDVCLRISREEARFWIKNVGAFVIDGGSRMTVIPENGCEADLLSLYVQGMMMAIVLHQRGMCVLHASVVEVNGAAIAFLGPVGFGKSSIAAALYSRGHRVVADDNAAIDFRSGVPMIRTAYPSLKLFPEIASSLGFRNGSVRPLHSSEVKIAGAVPKGFLQEPLPLRALYFLGRGQGSQITSMAPLKTVMELISNSVPTRWGHPGDAAQLDLCGRLASYVPAFVLETFTDLPSLPLLAETVEKHSAKLDRN